MKIYIQTNKATTNIFGLHTGSFPVKFNFEKSNFEKSIQRCHNAMKFDVVNKSTILNRFVLHTLQRRNIAHLAVIARKTNIKLAFLKGGNWKRAFILNLVKPLITLTY